jgi:hypothetical protein
MSVEYMTRDVILKPEEVEAIRNFLEEVAFPQTPEHYVNNLDGISDDLRSLFGKIGFLKVRK